MNSSLIVSDVSVTTDENSLQQELIKSYDGIKQVKRWYFDDDQDYPMSCVQIDFNSTENMEKVLTKGTIVIGGICRRVTIARGPHCYRCQQDGHKTHECEMRPLNEQDLLNLFEEQKR
jgi:hypothetical protein